MNDSLLNQVVLPGDQVGSVPESDASAASTSTPANKSNFRVGAGLRQEAQRIVCTRAGVLRVEASVGLYYVETRAKRYVAQVDDLVLGTVVDQVGETFDVDVGAAHAAALPVLAFERVTKKNRPRLERGDVVYARVTTASKHLAPELQCVSKRNKADGFGPLAGGLVLACSLAHAAALLRKDCFVLNRLGREFPFEIAVGHNGRFWLNAVTQPRTLLAAQALINAEFLTDAQVDTMVTVLVQQARAAGSL